MLPGLGHVPRRHLGQHQLEAAGQTASHGEMAFRCQSIRKKETQLNKKEGLSAPAEVESPVDGVALGLDAKTRWRALAQAAAHQRQPNGQEGGRPPRLQVREIGKETKKKRKKMTESIMEKDENKTKNKLYGGSTWTVRCLA